MTTFVWSGDAMSNVDRSGLYYPTITGIAETRFIEALWPQVFDEEIRLGNLHYHTGCARFDEVLFIAAITRHLNPEFIFEIGTCEGRTTVNMARNSPRLTTLFTLNLPEENVTDIRFLPQDKLIYEQSKARIGGRFRNSPYEDKIQQIFADSDTYKFEGHSPIDLVLVDGGTAYETVLKGSQQCWNILRPGGVIIWRAYNYADGVTRGVDSFCKRNGVKAFNIYKTTLAVAWKC